MRASYGSALVQPLHLAMLMVAAGAGLCAAWWLFPVGLLLWGLMLFFFVNDPARRLSTTMQRRSPLAPRFQPYFDQVERSQVGIFNALAASEPRLRRTLEPVRVEVDRLTDKAYGLCQRMTALENHQAMALAGEGHGSAMARLDAQIAAASDALIRREYEESRLALQSRQEGLRTVTTFLERVEAQLVGLTHELDRTLTEVVRAQAVGAEQASKMAPALTHDLRRLSNDLQLFEQEAAAF